MKELRALTRWLVWKKEARDGKTTKIPYSPLTNALASSTDSKTWCSYEQAKNSTGYDGIGCVIAEPYCAIDIDHCIENGIIADWAGQIIDGIDSVTEYSPSGTGVHIWIKHRLPGAGRKRKYESGVVELYDRARYFTVTEKLVPGSTDEIREYNADWLYDLIDSVPAEQRVGVRKGLIARAPVDFEKLFRGEWENLYTSQSEADLALCGLLARKYSNNTDKIDEEFRKSALYREKWERDDYREKTIKKATEQKDDNPFVLSNPSPSEIGQSLLVEETEEPDLTEELPEYPYDVWQGTPYHQFSELCGKGNPIPKQWLLESLKTATGAVMGHCLDAEVEGAIPRFYTILIGEQGAGKGTSIKYVADVFNGIIGTSIDQSLLWGQLDPIDAIKHKLIGACRIGFASMQGMQRALMQKQARWLQVYEEFSILTESSQIKGSGESLLGVNRELYDSEHFTATGTGSRDSFSGTAQNSILAGTTKELWNGMFAGVSVEGSGLFARLMLIPNDTYGKRVPLRRPDLTDFKRMFIPRLLELEGSPRHLKVSEEAISEVTAWSEQFEGMSGDESGRLDVLAWRNALHLAFWKKKTEIDLEEIRLGLRLSDYQFQVRKEYRPTSGKNQTALMEDTIMRILRRKKKPTTVNHLWRLVSHTRLGAGTYQLALKNLQLVNEIRVWPNPRRPSDSYYVQYLRNCTNSSANQQ